MSGTIRKGVKSVSKSGDSELTGDVTFSEGSNVTITQSGQDIEIAASGGGGGGSMDDFLVAGDSGSSQTIDDGDTLTIAGGTGVDTAMTDDTVTINLDSATQASLSLADSAMQELSDDTSPSLGGNLDAGVYSINIGTVGSLSTNSIVEAGPDDGVEVDGVLIKDTTIDVNGTADAIILDSDGDTTISAPTDDQIDFEVGGSDAMSLLSSGLRMGETPLYLDTDHDSGLLSTTDDQIDIYTGGVSRATVTDGGLALATGVRVDAIRDEDDMSSDDEDALATQQSIKAFVEAEIDAAFLAAHPVGTTVLGPDDGANPNTYIRGCSGTTWERITGGRSIVGVDDSDGDFDVNDTGGAKTHTLTEAEMPSHTHLALENATGDNSTTVSSSNSAATARSVGNDNAYSMRATTSSGNTADAGLTSAAGSGNAHSILNPYHSKYIWQRTA